MTDAAFADDEYDIEAMLTEDMAQFFADPLGFVLYVFPWETDPSIQLTPLLEPWLSRYPGCNWGPDVWACEYLDELGREVQERGFDLNAPVPVAPIRFATVSGHGIGKSALTAWLILWIMSTRPRSKGTVTAGTMPQLKSKTWAELGKWHKMCVTGHWFKMTSGFGNMSLYSIENPDDWRVDGQTCKEENSDAFQGQHAASGTSFYIFDEASAVPDKIWEVAEGGQTDGHPMWFVFGNPTRNVGRFRECFRRERTRWITRQIDSREVHITNKALLGDWETAYGENSDFFKVRVRGIFPHLSVRQFISEKDVDQAVGRHLRPDQYQFAPKIIGVDPAWEGDDEFVIVLRQGLYSKVLAVFEKNDNDIEMANIIAGYEREHKADAVFIDAGYGTGLYSAGKTWGLKWQLVWFGSKASQMAYKNKRTEIWGALRQWIKDGGAIPDDEVLRMDLVSVETVPRTDGIYEVEPKNIMKGRGIPSPNRADALAITFAFPVRPKVDPLHHAVADQWDPIRARQASTDWDPYKEEKR